MATKSILKNVNIKNKRLGRNFVNALEKARNEENKEIKLEKKFKNVKQSEIKDLFRSF